MDLSDLSCLPRFQIKSTSDEMPLPLIAMGQKYGLTTPFAKSVESRSKASFSTYIDRFSSFTTASKQRIQGSSLFEPQMSQQSLPRVAE
jgi:hypothetical protein